jgi:nucleotide-binding universal stress UspA family protein
LFQLKDKGTKVILVDVVSINPIFTMISPVSYMSAIEGNLKMTGEVLLAEGEKVLSELGISNSEMKLVEGNPAEELIKVAKATQAGLIIAGSQGKGAVEHFLLGSTSTRLAAHADCPVAIFKGGNGKG